MSPTNDTDYKKLFSELIKKQMLVLGPDITLAKVKNVIGLTVDVNGEVIKLEGDPQQMLQGLINQFVELSGMIVKKTMESILTSYPGMMAMAGSGAFAAGIPVSTPASSTPATATDSAVSSLTGISEEHHIPEAAASNIQDTEPKVPSEPPPLTSMHLDSLTLEPKKNQEASSGPQPFSPKEMQDLNKALDELSKAPLSTESQPSAQVNPVP